MSRWFSHIPFTKSFFWKTQLTDLETNMSMYCDKLYLSVKNTLSEKGHGRSILSFAAMKDERCMNLLMQEMPVIYCCLYCRNANFMLLYIFWWALPATLLCSGSIWVKLFDNLLKAHQCSMPCPRSPPLESQPAALYIEKTEIREYLLFGRQIQIGICNLVAMLQECFLLLIVKTYTASGSPRCKFGLMTNGGCIVNSSVLLSPK